MYPCLLFAGLAASSALALSAPFSEGAEIRSPGQTIQRAGQGQAQPKHVQKSEPPPDPRPEDEREFDEVKKKALADDDEAALRAYLANRADSRFAEEARWLIDEVQFAPARRENSPRSYAAFIANYPNNRHREEAGIRAEELMFAPFAALGTIEAYSNFVESFPGNRFAPVARAAVEDLALEEVKKANTLIGYAEFLRVYPESPRAPEALELKDALEFAPYRSKDNEEAYAEFLRNNPVNHNRAEAQKRHDELRDARVKDETDKICNEAKNAGKYNCDFVSFADGTLSVRIIKLSEVTQGQQLLMGGPGFAEEIERRYREWKQETIKQLLRILEVVSVTVE